MYIHRIFYLCRTVEHEEQVNDLVYKGLQYSLVTYLADENGNYDIRDRTKSRFTAGHIDLDPVDTNNFIPHSNVTPDIVINWIKAKINETELQNQNIAKFSE